MGLMRTMDVDCLIMLRYLRTLSFVNNTFAGPMLDVKKLSASKSLYFSYNHFFGEITDGVILRLTLVSFFCSSKINVVFKITVGSKFSSGLS
jgi:hypothetical protein